MKRYRYESRRWINEHKDSGNEKTTQNDGAMNAKVECNEEVS
jgi:hypothetical protein